jgi:error-prone DNA polymerase
MGFIFLSIEDETGIANVVIDPSLYERDRVIVTRGKFLKVYGKLQNKDGIIHVKAQRLEHLQAMNIEVRSHDFH